MEEEAAGEAGGLEKAEEGTRAEETSPSEASREVLRRIGNLKLLNC